MSNKKSKIKLVDIENENVKNTLEEIKKNYEDIINRYQEIQDYDQYVVNEYYKWLKEPYNEPFELFDIEEIPYLEEDIIISKNKIKKLKKQYNFILDILE